METNLDASQTMVSVQPNMQAHDELAALFSRNLTFNPDVRASIPRETPQFEHAVPVPAQPIVYSVSQHYNHTAHIMKPQSQAEQLQRSSSEPLRGETMPSETVLRLHGINPATLTPSQLQLFRIADPPQQRRLLELWSICPPSQGGDIPSLAWSSTTLEQEENMARVRYERSQQQQTTSLDGTTVQIDNGRWHQQDQESEPYMNSGYEEIMRREQERESLEAQFRDNFNHFDSSHSGPSYSRATDPVYMGPDFTRQQQQMEMATQYGTYDHFRGAGEVDIMDVM